ncbi:MAG: hypothetical protein NC828_02630, partial [Candidatus Omnitrophica bacterium]|nr:hypothetical protein [Candidatus Omnitrophota bacterium]
MIAKYLSISTILFLVQMLGYTALAQEELKGIGEKKNKFGEEVIIEKKDYDVSESIAKGKQAVLEEKKRLETRPKTKEEEAERIEEEAEEAREEIYEQRLVQEATRQEEIITIERNLQREKFRRQMMTAAGKMIKPKFKVRK